MEFIEARLPGGRRTVTALLCLAAIALALSLLRSIADSVLPIAVALSRLRISTPNLTGGSGVIAIVDAYDILLVANSSIALNWRGFEV